MYHSQRPYETSSCPDVYVNQQPLNLTPFDFNQSVVELVRCQTELAHSIQLLHQQTTDALEYIGKSSSFQENQLFINDIPIFKTKDSQSFDDWLEQRDKVAPLTNKYPYKLALAKSQGLFSRTVSSFPNPLGWNKSKEWLHYNFSSVATKQHVASMLIDQQQKPTETLEEYVPNFWDLLVKSSGLLLHHAKYWAHITYFICNLHYLKLQHYVLGKNFASVKNTITLG